MECKRYSLNEATLLTQKKYMNRNKTSIICVYLFLYWFSATQKRNVLPSWHKTLDTRISTFPGVASSFTPRPANRLEPYVSCVQHITSLQLNPVTQSTNLLDWGRIKPAHTKMNNQIPHNYRKKWPGVSNIVFFGKDVCVFCYLTIVSDYGV